jgi:hypothetical protein
VDNLINLCRLLGNRKIVPLSELNDIYYIVYYVICFIYYIVYIIFLLTLTLTLVGDLDRKQSTFKSIIFFFML